MRALSALYHPVTGTPFQRDETYQEVAPGAALAPYIRCFWGSASPLPARPSGEGIVIPDTCMDISPKTLASLMRYQLLWQEMLHSPRFDVLDAVDRFGYSDQSHLLGDFRRRHLMTPKEALAFARR